MMNNSTKHKPLEQCGFIYRKLDHFDNSTTSEHTILSWGEIVILLKKILVQNLKLKL